MTGTSLEIFNYEHYQVRTVHDLNGEVWFIASDVCAVLSIANVGNALSRIDEADIRSTDVWSASNGRSHR